MGTSSPIIVILALVALGGCAAVSTVTVPEPVPVPCSIPAIEKPQLPVDTLPDDADLFEIVRALWASLELLEAYTLRLEAAVQACQP